MDADTVTDTRFVFGFRMTSATQAATKFPNGDVYTGKELLGRKLEGGTGEDWAVVRLDRKVIGAPHSNSARPGRSGTPTSCT